MNKLSLTIPSDMTSTQQVDNFIELIIDRFQLPQSLNGRITLSIIEAVHNSILYGNKRAPEKKITITAIKNHTKVTVLFKLAVYLQDFGTDSFKVMI